MEDNLVSRRVHNNYSKKEADLIHCDICSKSLPIEYFEVIIKKPKGNFRVCSNDCEAVLWRILDNLKKK